MATSDIVQGKWNPIQEEEEDQYQEQEEEEEEEEALSLSDLPINLNDQPRLQEQRSAANEATQEEFNFRSWGAPFSKQPEMCVADEVFFKGQILPLRVSFSSEAGLLATLSQSQSQPHYGKHFINESLDFPSNSSSSSRSSSLRSQNSSTSTASSATIATTKKVTTVPPRTKPRIRNQFHMHPSPKPQLRAPTPTQLSSLGNPGRKSTSAWGIFRLGVVPAPEIGLQDLKVRNRSNCVSRNSSSNSSSNNSAKSVKRSNRNKGNDGVLKQLVGKGGGLLSGCDCSFQTVQSNNMVMIKGGNGGGKSSNKTESIRHAAKEKVVELKKQRQKQGKKVTSRRRTFEWIKELHASHPDDDDDDDEEALLSNA
ncbi:histone H3.v1 [Vigna radiata var. radiata]|uniref:Histone H3.v1 n=1 Tax=Vigna radiata var. radiata TaxID=3916 RepID=A0A1S3UNP5_VIGRR|nr:histone H3.v1 [Vigna radiata var. radiata]